MCSNHDVVRPERVQYWGSYSYKEVFRKKILLRDVMQ